jgi:putative PIG3 family NAD(P)H quinone oxidoreductase
VRAVIAERPGDESVLRLREVPDPPVGAGQLLIRVHATAVNRADLLQRRGLYPPPPGASEILGLECAGEVVAVGAGVSGWQVGDRAMALLAGGGYAELVAVDAGCAMPVPPLLSWEEAGGLPEVTLTVFLTLFTLGRLRAGETVLVHGGGSGVGTAAINLGTLAQATVYVTAGSNEKCRGCEALGAHAAFNYRQQDFVAALLEATAGRGADLILDPIGGPYLARNVEALAPGGRLLLIGTMGGRRGELDVAAVLRKRVTIIGSTLRARPSEEKARVVREFLREFGPALAEGRIRPVIDTVLPLEAVADAHRRVASSAHLGKVILRVR